MKTAEAQNKSKGPNDVDTALQSIDNRSDPSQPAMTGTATDVINVGKLDEIQM